MTDPAPPSEPAGDPQAIGRKARTRKAILDAAGELLAAQGVDATSIEQIAARAEVSVGAIYAHYGNKHGLVLAFVANALDVAERLMEEARQDPSPLKRVYAAGDAYFRFTVEHPAAARFAAVRVLQPGSGTEHQQLQAAMSKRVERMVLGVATDLKAAMDAGEIPEAPLDATMVYLWGMWNGVAALMLRQDGAAIPERLAARALETARITIEIAGEHVREHGRADWVIAREAANGPD